MGLKREEQRRAQGEGYYTSFASDASEILDYIAGDVRHVEEEKPSYYDGRLFKVTVTVEEV